LRGGKMSGARYFALCATIPGILVHCLRVRRAGR
jgi:hypothetical protein